MNRFKRRPQLMCVLVLLPAFVVPLTAKGDDQAADRLFRSLDRDGRLGLSLEEYLQHPHDDAMVARRDFQLFDLDSDGILNRAEFATIPTIFDVKSRGPLPDPLMLLVDQAVLAMDESFGHWNLTPERAIEVSGFVTDFARTIGVAPTSSQFQEADPDGDRQVSRSEARRFLEIQLGVKNSRGENLRLPNGIVFNYVLFDHIDSNKDGKLQREEFLTRLTDAADPLAVMNRTDINVDRVVTFAEWCRQRDYGVQDPVNEFRRLDANLDARVDPQELVNGTPESKRQMTAHIFPAFDMDRDGSLTLTEYRLTPLANPLLDWQRRLKDKDGDGSLSFEEFDFGPKFPLLRYLYFRYYNQNADQLLDSNEFVFEKRVPMAFYALNEDGSNWQKLFEMEGYYNCGSPDVSPDGKWMAFDAWKINPRTPTTIFVLNLEDKKQVQDLGAGMMPTWSKDGKQLCCSNAGVWIIDRQGKKLERIHSNGWGAQWSPDGNRILFYVASSLKIYDLQTKESRTVLDTNEHEYRQFYWNMAWSPDCRKICFKGEKPGGIFELAVLTFGETPQIKVHYSSKQSLFADFAWHPNGDRLVFAAWCEERGRLQLYEVDPDGDAPPTLVKGQDPNLTLRSGCWTPDGKQLIVVGGGD